MSTGAFQHLFRGHRYEAELAKEVESKWKENVVP